MNSLTVQNTQQIQNIDIHTAIDNWVRFVDASPKTIATYSRAISLFSRWAKENGISQPTREDIIRYRDELKADHKPATVNGYLMAIKQFYKWLEESGLSPNVAKNVKSVKMDREHKKDPLTQAQAQRLIGSIDRSTLTGARDYAIISLMLTTGARTIEVARANIEDIRPLGNFTAWYFQAKGHEERSEFKKVVSQVEVALREYLTLRGETDETQPLFISTANRNHGERLTTRSVSRIVKEHLKDAGLDSPRWTAHSLRHTSAMQCLLNGGTLQETQSLLGHRDINTTLIYANHLDRAKREAENRIATALFTT